jgi:hypothetical protein
MRPKRRTGGRAMLTLLACCAILGAVPTGVTGQGRVAGCHPFTVFHGHDSYSGSFTYRASSVKRASVLTCRMARRLLKAAYSGGPLKVIRTVYEHDSSGRPVGRPTYWLRNGWRCGNGAGGADCWNVEHPVFNAIDLEGTTFEIAVMANVGFRG